MPRKRKATKPQESEKKSPDRSLKKPHFPIIGVGASAGGLEALELFLRNVPEGSGMAFVIVQHLDPTHKGMMVQLLQRVTAMQVIQVKDRTEVRPDCVFVIPPNKDMSILHGVLHLLDPTARWASKPSRGKQGWSSCRSRPRPSSTACPAAP